MASYPLPLAAVESAIAALLGRAGEVVSIEPTNLDNCAYQSGESGEHLVVFRDGDREQRAVLRRLVGRAISMREEGVHVVAGERLISARPELGVAWIARPAGVVSLTLLPEAPSYLERLRGLIAEGVASEEDLDDARGVARALVKRHELAPDRTDSAYWQAYREVLEGARGLEASLDSIPTQRRGPIDAERLCALEKRFVGWRWRRLSRASRLRIVHGDAAPWSFAMTPAQPSLLYTSGPSIGDAALDVAELAAWMFAAAVREPVSWEDGLLPVWDAFWTTYLGDSGDHELLDVVPPFLAAKVLAYASATRAPLLEIAKRERMLTFAETVLAAGSFDPDQAKSLVR